MKFYEGWAERYGCGAGDRERAVPADSLGTFRMERGAAERCATVYTRLVDTCLDKQLADSERLHQLSGFGGFDSAKELQEGFVAKGVSVTEALMG